MPKFCMIPHFLFIKCFLNFNWKIYSRDTAEIYTSKFLCLFLLYTFTLLDYLTVNIGSDVGRAT